MKLTYIFALCCAGTHNAQDDESILNTDRPYANAYGLIPFYVANSPVGVDAAVLVDKIVLKLPFLDPDDFKEKRFDAVIQKGGVLVTMPTVSAFFLDHEIVKRDYMKRDDMDESSKNAHLVLCTNLKIEPRRRVRKVLYKFPPGITCTNDYFNKGDIGDSLAANVFFGGKDTGRTVPGENQSRVFFLSQYVEWQMFVQGTEKHVSIPDSQIGSAQDKMDKAFNSMFL